jgi:hypothetical protein
MFSNGYNRNTLRISACKFDVTSGTQYAGGLFLSVGDATAGSGSRHACRRLASMNSQVEPRLGRRIRYRRHSFEQP